NSECNQSHLCHVLPLRSAPTTAFIPSNELAAQHISARPADYLVVACPAQPGLRSITINECCAYPSQPSAQGSCYLMPVARMIQYVSTHIQWNVSPTTPFVSSRRRISDHLAVFVKGRLERHIPQSSGLATTHQCSRAFWKRRQSQCAGSSTPRSMRTTRDIVC